MIKKFFLGVFVFFVVLISTITLLSFDQSLDPDAEAFFQCGETTSSDNNIYVAWTAVHAPEGHRAPLQFVKEEITPVPIFSKNQKELLDKQEEKLLYFSYLPDNKRICLDNPKEEEQCASKAEVKDSITLNQTLLDRYEEFYKKENLTASLSDTEKIWPARFKDYRRLHMLTLAHWMALLDSDENESKIMALWLKNTSFHKFLFTQPFNQVRTLVFLYSYLDNIRFLKNFSKQTLSTYREEILDLLIDPDVYENWNVEAFLKTNLFVLKRFGQGEEPYEVGDFPYIPFLFLPNKSKNTAFKFVTDFKEAYSLPIEESFQRIALIKETYMCSSNHFITCGFNNWIFRMLFQGHITSINVLVATIREASVAEHAIATWLMVKTNDVEDNDISGFLASDHVPRNPINGKPFQYFKNYHSIGFEWPYDTAGNKRERALIIDYDL